ncbi:hypothetical protein AJ87_46075 [Rhizobium yanglingense]|nr:hypothetical protein AJ87_46075 [Rhizobium yanglingense]
MTPGGEFGIDLSPETMLEKDPEVLFIYDSGPDRPHENNPIWQELTAVKNKRVFYVGDQWVETNGPIARGSSFVRLPTISIPMRFLPST